MNDLYSLKELKQITECTCNLTNGSAVGGTPPNLLDIFTKLMCSCIRGQKVKVFPKNNQAARRALPGAPENQTNQGNQALQTNQALQAPPVNQANQVLPALPVNRVIPRAWGDWAEFDKTSQTDQSNQTVQESSSLGDALKIIDRGGEVLSDDLFRKIMFEYSCKAQQAVLRLCSKFFRDQLKINPINNLLYLFFRNNREESPVGDENKNIKSYENTNRQL